MTEKNWKFIDLAINVLLLGLLIYLIVYNLFFDPTKKHVVLGILLIICIPGRVRQMIEDYRRWKSLK